MKGQYKVGPALIIELEAANEADMFEKLAKLKESFGETSCGCCKSKNIHPDQRTVAGNTYLEWKCDDCGAYLAMSRNKEARVGQIYPVRRLLPSGKPATGKTPGERAKGKYGDHRGWTKWRPKKGENQEPHDE